MSTNESRISKRRVGAIIAAAATFAIVSASAATLGGLETQFVGAESEAVVAPISDGVALNFETDYANGEYVVTSVTLSANSDFPAGAEVKVTLADLGDESLLELTGTGAGDKSVGWDGISVSAHEIAHAAVVINGEIVAPVVTSN